MAQPPKMEFHVEYCTCYIVRTLIYISRAHRKHRKRVKRRGQVSRLRASAGGRKRPPGPTPEWLGYYRPIKKAVTLRLDADVLAWRMVPRQGRGYQTRINRALRKLMSEERKISEE